MKHYLIVAGISLLMACNNGKEATHTENEAAITVKAEAVTASHFKNNINLSGNIEGATTVNLSFMVPGKIEFISNREGQFISKGQLISSLETASYSLAMQLAEVKLNATTDEFNRLQLLHNRGSVSESDFIKIKFALQEAQLQVKVQRKNLSDTKLYSPISGVLLRKQAEPGEVIAAGTPLFVIANIKKVIVSVFIPESELHHIRIGQAALVNITALDKTFTGKITEVGSVADAASRAFKVKMEVDNTPLQIRPGMIAEVNIAAHNQRSGILIPAECIIHDLDNNNYIYVADTAQHKAFKRKVSLGSIIDNKIEIISGLSANETVITAGHEKLFDGSPISVIK